MQSIKELREYTGLSQKKFANKFHLNVRTVQAWEQNARNMPEYILYLIEKLLKAEERIKELERLLKIKYE